MHFTEKAKRTLEYLLELDAPESAWIDVDPDGNINVQCPTQAAVREFRKVLGAGTIWQKAYAKESQWWTYDTTLPWFGGIGVHVYACMEAPPTCKAIVEEIEVEEKVPVEWVTKKVKREVVKWDCGSGKEVEA